MFILFWYYTTNTEGFANNLPTNVNYFETKMDMSHFITTHHNEHFNVLLEVHTKSVADLIELGVLSACYYFDKVTIIKNIEAFNIGDISFNKDGTMKNINDIEPFTTAPVVEKEA